MTRIILIRHGHVEGISPPLFRGRVDLPLTKVGQQQARLLGAHLGAAPPPDAIYTSPLGRCIDTATAIAMTTRVQPEVLPDLIDFDYGDWTGRTHDEVRTSDPDRSSLWWTRPHLMRPPGGETLQELMARAGDVLRAVIDRHRNGRVILVGHDSINRALLLTMLDLPLSAYRLFEQAPCGLTEVDVSSEDVKVHSVNETLHLNGPVPGTPFGGRRPHPSLEA